MINITKIIGISMVFTTILLHPAISNGAERHTSVSETSKKSPYKLIVDDLLEDCTGVKKTIAVAGLSYSDGRDSADGDIVAERITTELVKNKRLKVIERKEIEKVFLELKFQQSGVISTDSVKEIGKMLGVDWIVVGTLTGLHDKQLELNIRLVGVEFGEIINAASGLVERDWLDQYENMLVAQKKKIAESPKDASAFYTAGTLSADLRKWDDAIANYSMAILLSPTYGEAYSGRGFAYVGKRETSKAIKDYSKAIAINPKDPKLYAFRGVAHSTLGMYSNAIEDFSIAISIAPDHALTYAWRGIAYQRKGENGKSLDDCSRAIELNPNLARPYLCRGVIYTINGEYDKAIAYFSKSIGIDPRAAEVYASRGWVYLQKEQYYTAIDDFSSAIVFSPEYANPYSNRAAAYRKIGENAKAFADEQKYRNLSGE